MQFHIREKKRKIFPNDPGIPKKFVCGTYDFLANKEFHVHIQHFASGNTQI